jgi:hypothetical protein
MKLLQLIKQLFTPAVPPKRYPAVNPKEIIYHESKR